jgi:hypothetical protein
MIQDIKEFFEEKKVKDQAVIELGLSDEGKITRELAPLFNDVFLVTHDLEGLEDCFESLQEFDNIHCAPFHLYEPGDLPIPNAGVIAAVLNSADDYNKTISDLTRVISDKNKHIRYVVITKSGRAEVDKAVMEAITNNDSIEVVSHPSLTILYIDRLRSV